MQINIPAISKTHNTGKDTIRYYTQRSLAIQAIQEHKATRIPLEVSMLLPLKWFKQCLLTEDKQQDLE